MLSKLLGFFDNVAVTLLALRFPIQSSECPCTGRRAFVKKSCTLIVSMDNWLNEFNPLVEEITHTAWDDDP